MATIIVHGGQPASHSQDARRGNRVYADVQVENEGDADGFAELVLMGDLSGTSGVREVRRHGGGALLKVTSSQMWEDKPYRVSAIVFEIVNGQRQTILQRHDNFVADIYVPGPPTGPPLPPPEEDDDQEERDRRERERLEREERERLEQEAWERRQREMYQQMAEEDDRRERERLEREEQERREQEAWERQQRERYQQMAEEDEPPPPPAPPPPPPPPPPPELPQAPQPRPVVVVVAPPPPRPTPVAEPWQTEETDWIAPKPAPFIWDPWMDEG